jgi:hypothetical protein
MGAARSCPEVSWETQKPRDASLMPRSFRVLMSMKIPKYEPFRPPSRCDSSVSSPRAGDWQVPRRLGARGRALGQQANNGPLGSKHCESCCQNHDSQCPQCILRHKLIWRAEAQLSADREYRAPSCDTPGCKCKYELEADTDSDKLYCLFCWDQFWQENGDSSTSLGLALPETQPDHGTEVAPHAAPAAAPRPAIAHSADTVSSTIFEDLGRMDLEPMDLEPTDLESMDLECVDLESMDLEPMCEIYKQMGAVCEEEKSDGSSTGSTGPSAAPPGVLGATRCNIEDGGAEEQQQQRSESNANADPGDRHNRKRRQSPGQEVSLSLPRKPLAEVATQAVQAAGGVGVNTNANAAARSVAHKTARRPSTPSTTRTARTKKRRSSRREA